MKKKYFLLLILFIVLNKITIAQESIKASEIKSESLQGEVLDNKTGLPLFGAAIYNKGSHAGEISNEDGSFRIQVNLGDVLIISSMGYLTSEIKIENLKKIKYYLDPNISVLEEIVVTGYGAQERRDLTGSISSVKSSDLNTINASFDNALAGKISGVQVNSSSGALGSATAITIRGISSLNPNSNNPLIVIDGIPMYGSNRGSNTSSFERRSVDGASIGGSSVTSQLENKSEFERNPLSMINMNDIESIEVLKDAYATAIYGSRGAAGVILITTKKGVKGKAKVNFSYSTTINKPVDGPSLLNANQYTDFYNKYYGGEYFVKGTETNWFDNIQRNGIANSLNASISAGTDKLNYFVSMSGLKQDAYIINQDYKKYNFRINLSSKLNRKLKIGLNFSSNFSSNTSINSQQIYRNAALKGPNISDVTKYGTPYFGFQPNFTGMVENPIAQANNDINYIDDNRFLGNLFIEYKPISWLTLKSEFGIDNFGTEAYSRLIERPDLIGGNATETVGNNSKYVVNNTISYVDVINDKHSINAVAGQSFEHSREQSTSIWGRKFHSDQVLAIGNAGENGITSTFVREWALFSLFARVNYQYDDRFLFGVTYRVDGSSRFNKENRYIGFPSFSMGWRLSEEDFMSSASWADEVKLRGSIGFTGIDGTSGYYGNKGQYVLQPNGIQYAGNQILQVQKPNNPNLKWENTRTIDIGIDASLLNNRISFSADLYHKKITNMLYSSSVPLYMGYSSQQQNIGDMENRGFELEITTQNIINNDFQWITNFNISKNDNKILKLNFDGSQTSGAELGYKYFAEGESAGQFFLYDWYKVDPMTGDPLWKYPDGTISDAPPGAKENSVDYRIPMGDAFPAFFGGLTNTFIYKGLELGVYFTYSYGGQLFNGTKALLMTYSTPSANNLSTEILDYWKIQGHETEIPRMHNKSIIFNSQGGTNDYTVGRDSDRFLEDSSFIRLKNIKLTYNFPQKLINKAHLSNLSLFAQATNVITFTNYTGSDPEVSAFGSSALLSGYDELTMPQVKSMSFGINVGF